MAGGHRSGPPALQNQLVELEASGWNALIEAGKIRPGGAQFADNRRHQRPTATAPAGGHDQATHHRKGVESVDSHLRELAHRNPFGVLRVMMAEARQERGYVLPGHGPGLPAAATAPAAAPAQVASPAAAAPTAAAAALATAPAPASAPSPALAPAATPAATPVQLQPCGLLLNSMAMPVAAASPPQVELAPQQRKVSNRLVNKRVTKPAQLQQEAESQPQQPFSPEVPGDSPPAPLLPDRSACTQPPEG
ncbi:unnamed protein product, partial [Prorocentrum cordatum]